MLAVLDQIVTGYGHGPLTMDAQSLRSEALQGLEGSLPLMAPYCSVLGGMGPNSEHVTR